jgi:hypothetical protein
LTVAFGRATTPRPASSATASPTSVAQYGIVTVAGPPQLPCIFPSNADLSDLAGASDLVVAGTAEGGAQVVTYPGINQPFTRYVFLVRSVLRGPTVSGVLTIEEAGGVVQPLLTPGPQVAFLYKVQHPDGLTTYFIVNGWRGTFLTLAGGMTMQCRHGVTRPSDFVSDGESETAFSARVQQLTPTPRRHK